MGMNGSENRHSSGGNGGGGKRRTRSRRHADLTPFAQRLTPNEVVQHWFRRGTEYAEQFHEDHPTFPSAGPDGLYLLSQVQIWFENYHGMKVEIRSSASEHDEAMRAALGQR
jgi:hypothetical protein